MKKFLRMSEKFCNFAAEKAYCVKMTNATPLRYPGGKSVLTPFFRELFHMNHMEHVVYAEPYAGGVGAGVNLLLLNEIERLVINDANKGIYSFWRAVVQECDRLIEAIRTTPVNLEEWRRQKAIINEAQTPSFELGFATLFLSRTNRSGILNAGPIGGGTQESQDRATYKMDCRFNKERIIAQIQAIAAHSDQIRVHNEDAMDFLRGLQDDNLFVYLDPPYYEQGKALYLSYYKPDDHKRLASYLCDRALFRWVLSYDNVAPIREMYAGQDCYTFELNYSAADKKKGSEFITHSNGVIFPEDIKRARKNTITLNKITNLYGRN